MRAFDILLQPLRLASKGHALDLLLTLGSQILAEASPVENRESTPEVASNPILSPLNLSLTDHARFHRYLSFLCPLAEGQGVPVVFHSAPFFGA